MKAVTLRNIPADLARAIERKAAQSGTSVNKAVLSLLAEKMDLGHGKPVLHHDLDHLAGKWGKDEGAIFEKALKKQRHIDKELWA